MATEQLTKPAPAAKFESFVDEQLAQVRQRLRAADVGAAAILLVTITLGYAVVMAIFDLLVRGNNATWITGLRLGAFGVYLLAMGGGIYVLVSRWLRRINPYYCARELEHTLPDAKNSVINWLDLKGERLPSAIRTSLGQRAAKDLKQADADKVADPKQNWFLGGLAGSMLVVLVVIFAISPNQFGSLLARAFAPFREISLANRASIKLIQPAGDATVAHNQRIEFLAEIDGRFPKLNHPQAPTLWYRYGAGDAFVPIALEEDAHGQWGTVFAADLVRTGFWYKLSAGDAETPVHQITVRSAPAATTIEVTYRHRPYRKLADETVVFPNEHAVFPHLTAQRGTEATLVVHTNQPVREGRLQLEFGKDLKEVPGERLADDPKAFRCKFTLERSGQYRVLFKTQDNESNTDRAAYQLDVLDDLPPGVTLTKPGQDVSLAANGTLTVEGHAQDDFGVKSLALRVRVAEGSPTKQELAAMPYRPDKKFQFETGGYPTKIDYLDVLALDRLKTDKGMAFAPSPGMILEYWLEATDNSDYPIATGNVGRSLAYKIKIDPPKETKKQQEERNQAEQQKKKHDKRQDQQHQTQNDEQKEGAGNQGSNKSPEEREADKLKNQLDETQSKLKEELDRQQKQKDQGEGKGADPAKSENKKNDAQPPETNPKDSKAGQDPQQAGAKKDGDKSKGDPKSAEPKGQGDQPPPGASEKQQASEPKGAGNEKPPASAKGQEPESKSGNPSEAPPMNTKAGPKDDPKEQPSQGKDQGQLGGKEKTAQAKENGPKEDKSNQGAQAKGAEGNKEGPPPQAKNDKQKPENQAGKKGDSKPGNNDQLTKEKGQGASKPDAQASKNPPGADGQRKPATAKGNDEPSRKSEAKDGGGKGAQETQQGPPAQAKNQPKNLNAQPQGNAKETPGDQAKESATAKDEQGQGPPREPTVKDIERLKDQLKNGDPKAQQTAKELERNLSEAKDPQVRKAAEELLKEVAKMKDAQAKNEQPKEDPNATGMGTQNPMDKVGEPKSAQADSKDPNPMSQKGETQPKSKPGDQTGAAPKPGGSGPNGQDAPDNLKPTAANKAFADRAGNLQLEELKSKITPEMRKLAGVSDEEWHQFLKNAQAYEELRNRMQNQPKNEPDKLVGKTSKLVGAAPRQVMGQPGVVDRATIGQPQAPPELREAQRLFTRPMPPSRP